MECDRKLRHALQVPVADKPVERVRVLWKGRKFRSHTAPRLGNELSNNCASNTANKAAKQAYEKIHAMNCASFALHTAMTKC
jgi:hypothetical protein